MRTDSAGAGSPTASKWQTAELELEAIGEFEYAVTNDDLDVLRDRISLEIIRAERDGASVNRVEGKVFAREQPEERVREARAPPIR